MFMSSCEWNEKGKCLFGCFGKNMNICKKDKNFESMSLLCVRLLYICDWFIFFLKLFLLLLCCFELFVSVLYFLVYYLLF